MKKGFVLLFVVVAGLMLIAASASQRDGSVQGISNSDLSIQTKDVTSLSAVKPDLNFGKFPLYFITNKGQVNQMAAFYAKASRYTLWLTKEGLVFDSVKKTEVEAKGKARHSHSTIRPKLNRDVSRLFFLNARKNPEMVAMDEAALRVNYFKGKDKSKWHGDVPTSMAVLYKNLYKGIDLKVYGMEKQVEYDWVVKAGGNPGDIRFEYKNVKGTRLDQNGNLLIETGFGELMHKKPVSYQETGAGKTAVDVRFKKIGKNTYGFSVGVYDRQYELVIDPVILPYSTYLGGSDYDYPKGIAVDSSGYVYVTGDTESTDFPTLDQYQTDPGDNYFDVFVTKIDPTESGASSLIYSTYLGGGSWEYSYGIAVDGSGNAYVTGHTNSTNFPTLNQYQSNQADADVFFTKLDTTESGTSSLVYSTYLGGGNGDYGGGIAVDSSGYAYVTGYTFSTNFPTLNQYQSEPGDSNADAFIIKIDPTESGTSSLIYSTYLGGGSSDIAFGIAVDNSGNAYVTGETESTNFPTLNQYQTDQGSYDAFVTKIDTTESGASCLIYSTYLGSSNDDYGTDIAVDGSGNAYVVGNTNSTAFPTLNQYQTHQGSYDAFVTKLDTTESGTSSLIFSTYLGGSSVDGGGGIEVDGSGNAYVVGGTSSDDFPTLNQYQADQTDADVFVLKLNTNESGTSSLIFSTYLGGSGYDSGNGIAVDGSGDVYVTGDTESTDFPTQNQYMSDPGDSVTDAFVTKLVHEYLTVISPNGGESWNLGKIFNITWEAHGLETNLRISLYNDGSPVGVIASEIDPDLGTYAWTVGQTTSVTASPDTGYVIVLREIGKNSRDTSDASFTICSLVVTAPNGGESWQIGSTQSITWNAQAVAGNLKVTLWKDGVLLGVIVNNLDPSSGSYSWTAGQYGAGTAAAGTGYTIKIKEIGTAVADFSDSSFTLTN